MSTSERENRSNQNSRIGKQSPVGELLNDVSINAYNSRNYCNYKPLEYDFYQLIEDDVQQL